MNWRRATRGWISKIPCGVKGGWGNFLEHWKRSHVQRSGLSGYIWVYGRLSKLLESLLQSRVFLCRSQKEKRQILDDLTSLWNLKKSQTHRIRDRNGGDQRLRWGGGRREGGDVGQREKEGNTSGYKTSKFCRSNVQHGGCWSWCWIKYLIVAQRVSLKCSCHKR